MRRTTMTIGLYLLVVGLILTGIGLLTNAPKTVAWSHGFKVSRQIDQTKTVEKFDSIKVDKGEGEVKVIRSNNDNDTKFRVQVIGDQKQAPTYNVKDKTLNIDRKNNLKSAFGNSEQIVVTVPKDTKLKKVDLHLGSDQFTLKGFTVNELVTHKTTSDDEPRLRLENIKVLNSANLNLGNYFLSSENSQFKNLVINGQGYDDGDYDDDESLEKEIKSDEDRNERAHIRLENTSIDRGVFDLQAANLSIKDSNLNNVQAKTTRGSAVIVDSTLAGINSFNFDRGIFLGTGNNVDGVDLSNQRGKITFDGNTTSSHSYQSNQTADNLLKVSGDRLAILIR